MSSSPLEAIKTRPDVKRRRVGGGRGSLALNLTMDFELSEEQRLTVNRARKVQRYLSQPFHVAEQFTGRAGKYVKLEDTIRSFKRIVAGEMDDIPEQAFYMCGPIEEVFENAEKMKAIV